MRFTATEKRLLSDLLKKIALRRTRDAKIRTIGFSKLFALASREESAVLERILALSARSFGFKGPRYGITKVPRLVAIDGERTSFGKQLHLGVHYLPHRVFRAYSRMNEAMEGDIGRRVFVASGYRSPAYQLVVFLETLAKKKFNIKRTMRSVALPGWSEHGAPHRQAIDLTTLELGEEGMDDTSFERTAQYRWLKRRAHEFGFHLSYPRRNKWGVMFEPWHWHCDAKAMVRGKQKHTDR